MLTRTAILALDVMDGGLPFVQLHADPEASQGTLDHFDGGLPFAVFYDDETADEESEAPAPARASGGIVSSGGPTGGAVRISSWRSRSWMREIFSDLERERERTDRTQRRREIVRLRGEIAEASREAKEAAESLDALRAEMAQRAANAKTAELRAAIDARAARDRELAAMKRDALRLAEHREEIAGQQQALSLIFSLA